jgi:transcriptional regulator with XRE-family HTH domain
MSGRKIPIMSHEFLTFPELARELGAQVRDFRIRKGLEQAEVAERAGVSDRTVRNLELGHGSSVDTLLRVMKALGSLEGLDQLFPPAATVDPLALLKRSTPPRRVSKKRGPRA